MNNIDLNKHKRFGAKQLDLNWIAIRNFDMCLLDRIVQQPVIFDLFQMFFPTYFARFSFQNYKIDRHIVDLFLSSQIHWTTPVHQICSNRRSIHRPLHRMCLRMFRDGDDGRHRHRNRMTADVALDNNLHQKIDRWTANFQNQVNPWWTSQIYPKTPLSSIAKLFQRKVTAKLSSSWILCQAKKVIQIVWLIFVLRRRRRCWQLSRKIKTIKDRTELIKWNKWVFLQKKNERRFQHDLWAVSLNIESESYL